MYDLSLKIFLTFLILAVLMLPITLVTWRGGIAESFLGTYLRYMGFIILVFIVGLFLAGVSFLLKLIWG